MTIELVKMVWPLQSQAENIYGNPASHGWYEANVVAITCPWPLFMGKMPVAHIAIHRHVAESLTRVLNYVWDQVGHDVGKIRELKYDQYDGSYNYRPIRGGTHLSMHSYACAIDWDAADNEQHSQHHLFTNASPLIAAFKAEGWVWGGDWSPGSIDAMHVQAARIG